MSDNRSGSGALAFIVGGLVVAVGVIAFVLFGGHIDVTGGGDSASSASVTVETGSESASAEADSGSGDTEAAANATAESGESDS